MLVFNPFLKTIERYEPHGARTGLSKISGYFSEGYDKEIRKHILKALSEEDISTIMPTQGFNIKSLVSILKLMILVNLEF